MKDLTLKMSKNEALQAILQFPTTVSSGLYVSGCREGRVQILSDKNFPGSESALNKIAENNQEKIDNDFVWETWDKNHNA